VGVAHSNKKLALNEKLRIVSVWTLWSRKL